MTGDPIATLYLPHCFGGDAAFHEGRAELERRARIEARRDAWQKKTGGQVTLLANSSVVLEWYETNGRERRPGPSFARGDTLEAALNAAGAP